MTSLIALSIVAFVILVPVAIVIAIYNRIVSNKNGVKRAWATVLTYQRKALRVLPKIEEVLNNFREYEKEIQEKITRLRTATEKLSDDNIEAESVQRTQKEVESLLSSIRVAVEAYPELKTADIALRFVSEIAEQEANVAASISIFNQNVQIFNDQIQTFPGSFINGLMNREAYVEPFKDSEASSQFEYQPVFK